MEENVKKNVYVCITESLCYTVEINNIVNQFFLKKEKAIEANALSFFVQTATW